jgi:hypothetical protein
MQRCGNKAAFRNAVSVDPMVAARALWSKTHPLPQEASEIPIDDGRSF